jgi:uncharacterized membrane protein
MHHMNWDAIIVTFFRWLHVISACIAVGGVFFMRVIVPIGLGAIDATDARHATLLRLRRAFKMVVHTCILLLLASGIFNTMRNWSVYTRQPGLMHGLWGMHVILALVVFGIALYVLMGKEPPANHRKLMATNVVLMMVLVAFASSLKWAREHAPPPSAPGVPAALPHIDAAR